jgi:AcrR family transcriptional regulator
MAAKVSLRDRRTAETRQRILDAAFALFVDQGFDATTIDEIAERADVAPRTFFRYFATKDALLFHEFEQRLAEVHDRIRRRPAGEPPGATFVGVLCEMVDEVESTPEERALLVRLMSERPALLTHQRVTLAEQGERQVAHALAERTGLPPDDLGLRAMVAAVSACFDVALRDWIEAGATEPFARTLHETLRACATTFPRGEVRA